MEMNELKSNIFDLEKGVPQGLYLRPIFFLLHYHSPTENIPSATRKHLYTDDFGLVFIASPW